jgi:hypothetical protein
MAAIVSVIAVVLISMLINRFATIALSLTGMSREEARFQARAAMSGVGLTTSRAEDIVSHPVRRKIVLWLMILGSAGIVTAVASLVLSFRQGGAGQQLIKAGILVGGLFLLWFLSRTGPVDRALTRLMAWILRIRGYDVRDFDTLLALSGNHTVAELRIREEDWMADRTLRSLRLRDEGVVVMGIHREGVGYIGAPSPDEVVHPGDTLVVYGTAQRISELDRRRRGPAGDRAHDVACLPARSPAHRTGAPARASGRAGGT